jgi:4-hydroxybenzoate polyprenyltransferase
MPEAGLQSTEKSGGRSGKVADAAQGNWVDRHAPEWLKPYARLARWDRPLPLLLLFWPCGFGLGLYAIAAPAHGFDFGALLLFLIGAVAMRGAGCTFNDIVDTDIDMKVARTRSRPIPSGQVSKTQAAAFLVAQAMVGFLVLLQFNWFTIGLGVSSLLLVAIYPFMKRITWWPQLFLGLAFNWGVLIGWSSHAGGLAWAPVVLYAGSILWTIGYDTIYALQDIEDDALIGVKSTARLFGRRARMIVGLFYTATIITWGIAAALVGASSIFYAGLAVVALMLGWQVWSLEPHDTKSALLRFRSNHWVGLVLTLSLIAEWVS